MRNRVVNHGYPVQKVHLNDGFGRMSCKGMANYPELTDKKSEVTCKHCKGVKSGGRPSITKTKRS